MSKKIIYGLCLFLIFIFALFLRIYFSYPKVFSEPIKYSADDGVYHMRLIENELLGNHFPQRIYFDPYTYFPYGTYHFFAPLYDQLLAGIIWLAGLGHPSLELINKIAPFYPAVLGSLMVFLIYFLAKAIWDRKVALLSAFLMAISSPYLSRSLLGTTDHHVAEVLLSTLAMLFLISTLKARRKTEEKGLENSSTVSRIKIELKDNRKFWFFTLLTGFSLGLYFLTWSGALLFLFIIFIFIFVYYLTGYFFDTPPNWILIMGVIIFLIALIMISPFFGHPDLYQANIYNTRHLEALIFGIFGFIFLGFLANFFKRKKVSHWFLSLALALSLILFLVVLRFIFPALFKGLLESFQAINTSFSPGEYARRLTGEMIPLHFQGAIDNFSALFYLSLIALIIILYQFIKKRKPEYLLIFLWTSILILMTGIIPLFGQMRFIYYLSVNISFLAAFLIVKGFEFGWQGLKIAQGFPQESLNRFYLLVSTILIIFNVIFFLLFPYPFNIGKPFPQNLPEIFQLAIGNAKSGPFVVEDDWYKTLEWLKENTPDPGINYYALYQEPGVDKETGKINPYPYPQEAYGVLAQWDVGHMITYYAHRIPNANPFHQGVGKKEGGKTELGEAIFFLETDEEKATQYLRELGTRYVITDYQSANPETFFPATVEWIQGNLQGYSTEESGEDNTVSKYDNSMIARLHILDGRELEDKEKNFYVKPLDHFRLIYESNTTMAFPRQEPNDVIKAVKIFEYVKGAKIMGEAKPGVEITLSTEVETNQGRKFVYQKSIIAEDGHFEFIVPYSTSGKEGRLPNQTQFEVFASFYKLKIGEKIIDIDVSESDVLEGKIIRIK